MALETELSEHLGYDNGDPVGRVAGLAERAQREDGGCFRVQSLSCTICSVSTASPGGEVVRAGI